MKINKQEHAKFTFFLSKWEREGKIQTEQREALQEDLASAKKEAGAFDWKNLSFLSFFFAIVCIILATSLMLIDDWLERILNYLFDASDWLKSLLLFVLSALLYFFAYRRRQHNPKNVFSNESLFLFGAVAVAFAITYLGFSFDMYDGYFPILILVAAILYGIIGLLLDSVINWYLALGSLGLWFGTETAYRSGWEEYFLGMNYPMRYVLFGILLIGLYLVFRQIDMSNKFKQSTYATGLLSLFFSFWLLSIFGNYADLDAWSNVSQSRFIYWVVILAVFCCYAIWYGLKYEDRIARELGIIFLLLNIYTRYFEYFWDSLHKVVFFIILAASFWLIGRKAENLWSLADRL